MAGLSRAWASSSPTASTAPLRTNKLIESHAARIGLPSRRQLILLHATAASKTSRADLKAELVQTVTRLNSAAEADDPTLQACLLQLVQQLAAVNPTLRPAESALINGRWALLYTLPDKAKGDVKRDPLNIALAASYDFFYKYVPIIAGSAVGSKASSRQAMKVRGQFQTFDTQQGWVGNQARFEFWGKDGVINVDGPASVVRTANGERIEATFKEAELNWGDLRIPFPIGAFSPSGYIDTVYLDEDLRISKGDKGSIFIARRAGTACSSAA
eukprot:GHRR01009132.1.p1 GENE.GHRR01009132.1~~GHRR01009132.1.p1  ORF type:complete len:272 (+),score=87.99 GHRR01009132.1:82-897(+)